MLESEKVIVESPMSFVGSGRRAVRMLSDLPGWPTQGDFTDKLKIVLLWSLVIVCWTIMVLAWWALICVWYVTFGILVVPYRLIRRSQRQSKKRDLQHREILERLEKD